MLHAEPFASDEEYRRTYFDAWEAADLGSAKDVDRPLIAQLGGDDPHTILRAARILEPHVDAIDINFGCPTEDARRGGHNTHSPHCRRYGAYLLRDPQLVAKIVGTVAAGLRRVPVTAKIRLLPHRQATLELAMAIEEAGAAALCVHGRTIAQRPKYAERDGLGQSSLSPSWEAIADVRRSVNIPVISNGGIETRLEAVACLQQTGAAAVMSAEALLEDPALFSADRAGEVQADPQSDISRMLRLGREFLDLAETFTCPLKYPPTKSHLFKMLHRMIGADQATARRKEALVAARKSNSNAVLMILSLAICSEASYSEDFEMYSQVSLDEPEQELFVDIVISSARAAQCLVLDEVSPNNFCCKLLVPAYYAGGMIGKRGKNMTQIEKLTQTSMSMSGVDVFFPGTQDRMLTIFATTKRSFVNGVEAIVREMWRMSQQPGQAQQNHHFVVKLVVPNSAAGKIIGRDGSNTREMKRATGCRISISRRNPGIQERVVVLLASKDGCLVQGAVNVLECIQDDPHLHEHMDFKYDVELPLGCWDCGKPGPAEPDAELMTLEEARVLPKRCIVEHLMKAAPREILVRHRLLGGMRKILKVKTHDMILAALEEALRSIPDQNQDVERSKPHVSGMLPVGLLTNEP
ncbi:Dus1l [Symbiodinium pilosum]|uniref:Dus1l protein n=1 Tax=Symbiodinium pilosum TaxID=2952 RepID=A0A812SSJ2_SYMPI|nr:Dus1l [Symbiodinium pilosum]